MPDTNDAARTVVMFGLGKIPEAGGLISGLVGVLWPASAPDVWGMIRANVEVLVNQKIADTMYQLVSQDLEGLRDVIADYTTALHDSESNPAYIVGKYTATLSHFERSRPHFQASSYEVLLLPLFAQFANLHLSLLRDGVTFGARWGWTERAVYDEDTKIRTSISNYVSWAQTWYQAGYDKVQLPGDSSYRIENWTAQNRYVRQMTLDVLDHAHYWPFFDPAANPGDPSKVSSPTRTIYSDPLGAADDTGISIPTPPTLPITAMNIWAWNYIDAIQVAHGGDWHPRQGGSGGSNQPSHGWSGDIDPVKNPIVGVSGRAGQLPEVVQLWFDDGSSTNGCGGLGPVNVMAGRPPSYDYRYEGHVVGSIVIMGLSRFYQSANCMVIGFRLATSFEAKWRPVPPAGRVFVAGKTLTWQMAGSVIPFNIRFETNGTGLLGDAQDPTLQGGFFSEVGNHPGNKFLWRTTADGIDIQFVEEDTADISFEPWPAVPFVLKVVNGRTQLDGNVMGTKIYSIYA